MWFRMLQTLSLRHRWRHDHWSTQLYKYSAGIDSIQHNNKEIKLVQLIVILWKQKRIHSTFITQAHLQWRIQLLADRALPHWPKCRAGRHGRSCTKQFASNPGASFHLILNFSPLFVWKWTKSFQLSPPPTTPDEGLCPWTPLGAPPQTPI